MIDLKPCPFCGENAITLLRGVRRKIYGSDREVIGCLVVCSNCDARIFKTNEDLLIKLWNRRVNE